MKKKIINILFCLMLVVGCVQPAFADTQYVVVENDWLSKIAQTYNTTYQELAEYNGIANPHLIYPGQVINIPDSDAPAVPVVPVAPAVVEEPAEPAEPTAGSENWADTILTNGVVFTSDTDNPQAEAIAIKGDRIIYVGDADQAELDAITGPDTVVKDLDGKFVMPGIIDSHNQSMLVATTSWYTKLPLTKDVNEFLSALEAEVKENDLKAVWGMVYPADMFNASVTDRSDPMYGPDKAYIDNFGDGTLANIPIIIQDNSGHGFWFNSKALEYMEIDENTPEIDESMGRIVRYPDSQEPSGWMQEKMFWEGDLLQQMYEKAGWSPPDYLSVKPEQLEPVLNDFLQYGVTAQFEARSNEAFYQTVIELEKQGKLNQYYDAGVRFYNDPANDMNLENAIAKIREWQGKYQSEHLRINTLKFFMDGVHESGTAAVNESYLDRPDNFGELQMDKDTMVGVLKRLNEEGMDLHLHNIGDRATTVVLDAVEEAQQELGDAWRIQVTIAHLELVNDSDYERFAELGVIANVSPHWTGGIYGSGSLEYLGQERFDKMYRFQPLLEAGATVALSADTTTFIRANRYNPWLGMQIGMTRIDTEDQFRQEFVTDENTSGYRPPPEDVFNMHNLLMGFTINGAKQMQIDDKLGSLEEGKIANVIVLDRSPFEVVPTQLENIRPSIVFFDGKVVKGSL